MKRSQTGRLGLLVVMLAQLMVTLDATVVNVALPKIDAGLHFHGAALSWVLNAYVLAFGGLLLLGGRLGDSYGRRRVLLVGLALFTAASLAGGFAQSPAELIIARVVQGVGAALGAPSALALVTGSAADEADRHRRLALFTAVSVSGGSVGLVLGGLVTEAISWRWTLFINVPIGLIALTAAPRLIAETPAHRGRFDMVGAITAVGTATGAVYAIINASSHGWASPATLIAFLAAAVSLIVLLAAESRVPDPMLRLGLLRHRSRVAALIVVTLAFGAQNGMFFLIVQYLQLQSGFSPLRAGAAFLPLTLGVLAMSRVVARLVARFGARRLVLVGVTLLSASFLSMSFVPAHGPYAVWLFLPLAVNGLGMGALFMPAASLVVADVPSHETGAASGLLQTTQQLGGAIGLAVIASVYTAAHHGASFVDGITPALLTATGLSLSGALIVALLVPRQRVTPAGAAPIPEKEHV